MDVVTTLPWGRPLTEADLDAHPSGDAVVEVVDGSLVVIRPAGYTTADLGRKRAAYERAGVPAYWVVDPDVPRLIAWELVDGAYVEVADVVGEASWAAERPFPVTVSPAALLA